VARRAPLSAAISPVAIIMLLALLLLAALPTGAVAQSGQAMVRVVHLSAGTPAVDLYVDGTKTVSATPFKTASKYRSLAPGAHTFEFRPAGAAGSTPAASVRASVKADAPYTVVLMGQQGKLQAVMAKDDFTAPPAGRAKLRAIIAAPQAPPVDIGVAGGPILFRDVKFGDVTPFATVAAGRMSVEVRQAGTSRVLFTQGAATMPAGMIVTLAGTITATGQIETLPILDAAGAGNLPRGGVATGAGGTAPGQSSPPVAPALAVGLLAAAAWAARRRSRSKAVADR
jgi:Domain of unknown function (DUF4397)